MRLSVIIPVYNEEKTVFAVLDRVLRVPLDKEIIVVDDGSTDGTHECLRHYEAHSGVTVCHHDRNYGKGRAIRTGLELVTGDVVVIQDADLEYDPQDLLAMIAPIEAGTAQVVYGSRRLNKDNSQHSGIVFYLGGLFVTYSACLLYGLNITDEATCYKMIGTDLLKSLHLTCERFEFCPEVTAKLALRKIPIIEVPISYFPRDRSAGKKIGWRDAVEAFWTLLRFKVSC